MTLRPRQNGRHFPDDIFKWILLNENVWISINISLKFVPRGAINNIPTLVQVMAWRRLGNKPLSEPMRVRLPTHICVTWPQWVKLCSDYELTKNTPHLTLMNDLLGFFFSSSEKRGKILWDIQSVLYYIIASLCPFDVTEFCHLNLILDLHAIFFQGTLMKPPRKFILVTLLDVGDSKSIWGLKSKSSWNFHVAYKSYSFQCMWVSFEF